MQGVSLIASDAAGGKTATVKKTRSAGVDGGGDANVDAAAAESSSANAAGGKLRISKKADDGDELASARLSPANPASQRQGTTHL